MEIDGAKFRAALERLDRPQAWVARRVGVNRGTFHHYVTGARRLPPALYPRLASVLGTADLLRPAGAREKVAA